MVDNNNIPQPIVEVNVSFFFFFILFFVNCWKKINCWKKFTDNFATMLIEQMEYFITMTDRPVSAIIETNERFYMIHMYAKTKKIIFLICINMKNYT